MSSEIKDFRYYAEKAEHHLRSSSTGQTLDGARLHIARAQVYARLAAAAPVVKRPANQI